MKQEWLDRLRREGTIEEEGYRYRLQNFGDYGEIRRIPLDKAEQTPDIWDWEFVDKIKLESEEYWTCGAISLDGGHNFLDAEEAIGEIRRRRLWDYIYEEMDEEIRDVVEDQVEEDDDLEFLRRYLEISQDDLVIG